jgi:GWxTD domain-containing protein
MIRWLWLSFLILFLSIQVKAIQAVTSHAVFYLPDTTESSGYKPYIEIYWQINPVSARYMRMADSTLVAKIKTDVVISGDSGIISQDHFVLETTPRATPDEVLAHNIIDLHRYIIQSGNIKLQIRLTDMTDSTNRFNYTDSFTVSAPDDKAFYSDIQLLDTIYASTANTAYLKNDRQQIPLCTNFYDEKRNTIRYYAELYKGTALPAADYPLIQKASISKKPNQGIYTKFVKADTIRSGQILPLSGSFPLATLGSGNYYVNVALENNRHKVIASSATLFQRFNANPVKDTVSDKKEEAAVDSGIQHVNVLNLNKTFIGKYNLEQIKAILKMLRPVSDPSQIETINGFLKKPDDLYMRYFVYNYFAAINKDDPDQAWKDYSDKVKQVNKLFSANGTPGYLTDRGYIYLKYGPPDDQITVENEQGTLPYELWQYINVRTPIKNIDNAVFLFYRPQEMIVGFQLLYSTVPGEAPGRNWRSLLYVNGAGGQNMNSRAEQYIGNR